MAYTGLLLLVGTIMGIYTLLAMGLNIQWGDTGILNFAQAAFFMLGAYTTAILTTPVSGTGLLAVRTVGFDYPIPVGMAAGTVLAGLGGLVVALLSVRLDGDYLAMVTLAVAEIVRLVIHNEGWLTTGAQTLKGIPRPLESSMPIPYDVFYFGFVLVVVLVVGAILYRLSYSPFGRVLHGIREDEEVPRALGRHTEMYKLKAFGIGAAVAGLAGTLWAHYIYAIQPSMFAPSVTFIVWAALIIGGPGSTVGPVAGTVFIVGIEQLTRFIPDSVPFSSKLPYLRLVIIGVLLIAVLYYRPYGLFGNSERNLAGEMNSHE